MARGQARHVSGARDTYLCGEACAHLELLRAFALFAQHCQSLGDGCVVGPSSAVGDAPPCATCVAAKFAAAGDDGISYACATGAADGGADEVISTQSR